MTLRSRLGVALALLAMGPTARAQTSTGHSAPSSTVRFTIGPSAESLRWAFTLTNSGAAPLEVVIDRRLLTLEIAPSGGGLTPARAVPGGRRSRGASVVRCRAPVRPVDNESAARTVLAPGASYTEGFDLRELCGLRLPPALVPGALISARLGFGGRPLMAHAVVLDGQRPPMSELVATPVALPAAPAFPPAGPDAPRGDGRLRITAAGSMSAASADELTLTVRAVSQSPYPMHVFARPGLVRFELVTPQGRRVACRTPVRGYPPIRDFFVRLAHDQSVSETVQLGALCPADALRAPGIYRAQAIYEARLNGAEPGIRAFDGAAGSPYFFLRITRGARGIPYAPEATTDPLADAAPATPAVAVASPPRPAPTFRRFAPLRRGAGAGRGRP